MLGCLYGQAIGDIIALSERYDARIIEWVELAFKSGDISALELDEPYTMHGFFI